MKAVKIFWLTSFAIYLGVALYVYADAKDILQVSTQDSAGAYELSKQGLFYYGLAGLVLVNALVLLLANTAPYLAMPFKKRWQRDAILRKMFKVRMKEWIRGFALVANLVLLNIQLAVYVANTPLVSFSTNMVFAMLGVVSVVWILAYLPIFSKVPELD